MVLNAYYLDSPSEKVDNATLLRLGVQHWNVSPTNYEAEGVLARVCEERGYSYRDFVDSKTIPNLQEKLSNFLIEHLHVDEEIRFFVAGSGYFDLRHHACLPPSPSTSSISTSTSKSAEPYIRIHCVAGDMIVLPAGIYHRFVPDENMFFRVMRLFCGAPVWTPHNRSEPATEALPARAAYLRTLAVPFSSSSSSSSTSSSTSSTSSPPISEKKEVPTTKVV